MGQRAGTDRDESQDSLLALLSSVADELYVLVCEIVRLGESLSADEVGGDRARRICDLQSFDLLAQSALAQARLLKGIERALSSGDAGSVSKRIVMMIEDIPFHKARLRLYAAYAGNENPGKADRPWGGDGDLDWF